MLSHKRLGGLAGAAAACLLLAACSGGGGGGGSSSAAAPPQIFATLISFPTGAVPPGFVPDGFNTGAAVEVLDNSGSAPIANASVSINGTPLAYSAANQGYEGNIVVAPGSTVTLSVTAGGATYTASGTQFTSYPAISAPLPAATWVSSATNVVAWSGGAPSANSAYALGVLDSTDPANQLVWPSGNTLQVVPSSTTSFSINPNSLTVGNRLVIVGIATIVDVPNAAPHSGIVLTGFNYVPISVTDNTAAALLYIAVTPQSQTIVKGTTRQFTATGTYSDYSTRDLTTQVTWTSSDTSKATINAAGLATGTDVGSVTITATLGSIFGSTSVNVVTLSSIQVTPQSATIVKGRTKQFTATGTYSDNSTRDLTTQVTWISSDTSRATISATGLATGIDFGSATITAASGSIFGSALLDIFLPNPSPPPPLNQSVTYQIDYAHSGRAVFGNPLTFPATPTWSVTLDGAVSYPLIADGKVFVTTSGGGNSYGTTLYALDKQTGSVVWGPVAISGTYFWSSHAYDHGKVFVVNFDGLLRSFDAATGQAGWSTKLPGQYAFSSPPTAVDGIVYVGGAGSGGTLYAVDESNGNVIWTAAVANGDDSSPTVSSDGVFVSYPCQVYKFDLSGSPLWHYSGGCSGGGGRTSVYANGLLYVRDWTTPVGQVFNAATGAQAGSFNAAFGAPIPAFSTQTGFFQSGGTLQGVDLSSHGVLWSFAGDGHIVSAPIVIDDVVIVGSSSGNVYAVDAASGSQITWSANAGAAIAGPDEQNVSQPLTGFGAGEGYLIVPAGNKLTAWHISGP